MGTHIVEALGAQQDLLTRVWDGPSPPTLKLTRLLQRLLAASDGLLLLVLNRAEALGQHPGRDSLFGALRAWNCKVAEPHWPRLRLLLGLSTSPARLIANPDQSPLQPHAAHPPG